VFLNQGCSRWQYYQKGELGKQERIRTERKWDGMRDES